MKWIKSLLCVCAFAVVASAALPPQEPLPGEQPVTIPGCEAAGGQFGMSMATVMETPGCGPLGCPEGVDESRCVSWEAECGYHPPPEVPPCCNNTICYYSCTVGAPVPILCNLHKHCCPHWYPSNPGGWWWECDGWQCLCIF